MGESDNPGPSRRRRTQKCVMGWDSDSELEDDHRNLVPKEVKTGHLNQAHEPLMLTFLLAFAEEE